MKVGVAKESDPGETRVAIVPDTARRLVGEGVDVLVERGAGEKATFADAAYEQAGARLASTEEVYADAEVVCKVRKPSPDEVERLRDGQVLLALLQPLVDPELARALADRGVTAFSLDSIPRVTRAQPMDALSSQSTVAGYKAAILAAEHLGKFFPMLTTAAGTIPPAKVLVLGAGVAGLQAIATARRLGAVVSAFDVRPVVKEQVESLGATLPRARRRGRRGRRRLRRRARRGPARARAAADRASRGRVRRGDHDGADPGPPRPRADHGGRRARNARGLGDRRPRRRSGRQLRVTRPGETAVVDDVTVVGLTNVPATMPVHASQMYSRNVQAFLALVVVDGALALDFEDEIVRDTCVAHGGKVMREAAGVSQALLNSITVFVLSAFLGVELISRVPALLHTPLMSGTNAIHGIVLVGAMLIAGSADSTLEQALAFVAVVFATINVVGGFLVTDRMLEMFKRRPERPEEPE